MTWFQNIAKARKEVERLEAEEAASPATPTTSVPDTNGGTVAKEIELIKGAVSDVVTDLKRATIGETTE